MDSENNQTENVESTQVKNTMTNRDKMFLLVIKLTKLIREYKEIRLADGDSNKELIDIAEIFPALCILIKTM